VHDIARFALASIAAWISFSGCTQSEPVTEVERGRRMYMANCIVCHNPDPTKPGSAGPEVAGASRALIEARLLHASYPQGYTPKRSTKAMPPLPYLAKHIDDLAVFLAAAEDGRH
jgi:mono/diheme cytochrome c family protein